MVETPTWCRHRSLLSSDSARGTSNDYLSVYIQPYSSHTAIVRDNILKEHESQGICYCIHNGLTQNFIPVQEKERIKSSFKKAVETFQEEDDLFKIKKVVKAPKEEVSYDRALESLARNKEEKQLYQNMWGTDQPLDEEEDFLRKYILQKGWIDNSDTKHKLGKTAQAIDENDDKMSEEADHFEEAHNFRYQEPGSALIQPSQGIWTKPSGRRAKRPGARRGRGGEEEGFRGGDEGDPEIE